jgi:hypothetical protein
MSGKRTTPYFAFMAASREATKAALVAAGGPAAASDVAKALGEKWRSLSDEDKKARRSLTDRHNAARTRALRRGASEAERCAASGKR